MRTAIKEAPAAVDTPSILTREQLQEYLKISKSTLTRLLSSKKDPIPSFMFRKVRRFQLEKINWWIEKHEQ